MSVLADKIMVLAKDGITSVYADNILVATSNNTKIALGFPGNCCDASINSYVEAMIYQHDKSNDFVVKEYSTPTQELV